MKLLKRVQMLVVSEEGEVSHEQQAIYVDTKAPVEFVIRVPAYAVRVLGCPAEVRHVEATKATKAFEEVMRQYLDWIRTAKAEPVIVVDAQLLSADRTGEDSNLGDVKRDSFFLEKDFKKEHEHTIAIALSYRLLFLINGNLHTRKETEDGNFVPGHRCSRDGGVVLQYTPELHTRLDEICKVLHVATRALHSMLEAPDVSAALLAGMTLRLANKGVS